MTQVALAHRTVNLCATHKKRGVVLLFYVQVIEDSIKTRPTGTRVEFVRRIKECCAAIRTAIDTVFVMIVIFSAKGRLCPVMVQNVFLFVGEIGIVGHRDYTNG